MNKIVPIVIAVVIAGGAGFYLGTKFPTRATPTSFRTGTNGQFVAGQFPNGQTNANGVRTFRGGSVVAGSVLNADSKNLTIKLVNGGSQIVFLSATTTISKISAGSVSDLTPGTDVVVNGTTNSDGSITAENIQIRPAGIPAPRAN